MNEENQILFSLENAIDDDGWALIAPYGEWPKTRTASVNGRAVEQRFIQVLDNDSADALIDKENGLFRRIKRAVIGIPVYAGHPDLRDHAPETLANKGDKRQIGVVDQVRKGARGIEAHFVLSPEGATAVENGAKFPSALWLVKPCGIRGEATLARPFQLLSVGLTPYPNISGVESLANARGALENENENTDMKLIAGWLRAQGVALANAESPTETAILEAFEKLYTAKAGEVVALGNEKTTSAGKITELQGQVTALGNEKTQLTTQVTALENSFKSERKSRAASVVDLVITQGRLLPAERLAKIEALANCADEAAFTAEAEKLGKGARILKLTAAGDTKAVANDMTDADVTSTYCDAVKKHMGDTGEKDPIKAHKAVLKAMPALADALKPKTGTEAGAKA